MIVGTDGSVEHADAFGATSAQRDSKSCRDTNQIQSNQGADNENREARPYGV